MKNDFTTQFLMISSPTTIIFLFLLFASFFLIRYLYKKKQLSFSVVVLIGTALGLLLGILIQFASGFSSEPMKLDFIKEVTTWYSLFSGIFLHLIKVLVVPLVLVSIAQVIISMGQGTQMGKLIRTTLVITLSMVLVSSIVGMSIGLWFHIGTDTITSTSTASSQLKEITAVPNTLADLFPSNLATAMVENNIIGLVIFAAIFGVAAWWVHHETPELGTPIVTAIHGLHKVMINMALLILDFMPYAVVALLATTIASRGLSSILEVGKFILVLYLAVTIQFIIQLFALVLFGINPRYYLKKSFATMLLAFTSRSSVGCLPMTTETLTNRLGVAPSTANFVAGFGTTAGMQGCAGIFPSLLIVYVANQTGTPITLSLMIMTIFVVTIGSLGIAGIPGTATMAASVGLSGVGMASSFGMISPIIAIDPIIDMPRTLLNVTGSLTNALMVDKCMGTLNIEHYHNLEANQD